MDLRSTLKYLKVSGIRLTEIASKIGTNVNFLYSVSAGKPVSLEKEKFTLALLHKYYGNVLSNIESLQKEGYLQ